MTLPHPLAVSRALQIVPGAAIALAAILAFTSQSANPIGARLYGGPPGPDDVLAWRAVVVERDHGYYAPVRNAHIQVVVRSGAGETSAAGVTNEEGALEVRVPVPSRGTPTVDVSVRAEGVALPILSASVPVVPPQWASAFKRVQGRAIGQRTGAFDVEVIASRGAMAAPFPERVFIHVSLADSKTPAAQVRLHIVGEGFEMEPHSEVVTDSQGNAQVSIRPTHHSPRLEIAAETASGTTGTWEGSLPVAPGNLWLNPEALRQGRLSVSTPVGHRIAYVTVFNEHARLLAMQIPLASQPEGNAGAEVPTPPLPSGECWILASPDPQGEGLEGELLAWPAWLPDTNSSLPQPAASMRTPLLADGVPAAVLRERSSSRSARLRIIFLLAAATLLESALLYLKARQSRDEVSAILASNADIDEAMLHAIEGGERFWLRLVVAAVLVATVFGALAFVLWMQV